MNKYRGGDTIKKHNGIPVIDDKQALQDALEILNENLPFEQSGASNAETVFSILLRAAGGADSIENICSSLEGVPCGNVIRNSLKQYRNMEEMEEAVNSALCSRLPPRIQKGKQEVAIDYNQLPYYGNPSPEEAPYVCKSKAESGTSRFYVYATMYVIKKNKRVTLAIAAVRNDESNTVVINRLFEKIKHLRMKIKCLYLDRGFFSVPVIRWLKTFGVPFRMPVIIRGKNGGTRQLVKKKKSRKTVYTMESTVYGSVTFDVHVVCIYSKGKYKKNGVKVFAYAVNKIHSNPRRTYDCYRKRFGIETSYRMKNTSRIRTTMKNPVIRFLFVGISFVIINLWIFLLWNHVSYPRRGGRLIFSELFSLKKMNAFLCMAVNDIYKSYNTICL